MTLTVPEPATDALAQHALDLYNHRLAPFLERSESGGYVGLKIGVEPEQVLAAGLVAGAR